MSYRAIKCLEDSTTTGNPWAPDSWQGKHVSQQPVYRDSDSLKKVQTQLAKLPPLVTSWEVEALKTRLAEAARGERFLLQGGDCAESFEECEPEAIVNRLKILLQMSLIVVHGSKKPVIRVGRFAGQYAKPRSAETETRCGITLPAYKGDMINSPRYQDWAGDHVERAARPHRQFESCK
jgi:3-deoxy-7-phosphoheptulonate synthase